MRRTPPHSITALKAVGLRVISKETTAYHALEGGYFFFVLKAKIEITSIPKPIIKDRASKILFLHCQRIPLYYFALRMHFLVEFCVGDAFVCAGLRCEKQYNRKIRRRPRRLGYHRRFPQRREGGHLKNSL